MDPYSIEQEPDDRPLISNGDADMALHYLTRIEAGIDPAKGRSREALDALRYWIGRAMVAEAKLEKAQPIDDTECNALPWPVNATRGRVNS